MSECLSGGDNLRSKGGDEVRDKGGDEVRSKGGDEERSKGGDEVRSKGGVEVRSKVGVEVRSKGGDNLRSKGGDELRSKGRENLRSKGGVECSQDKESGQGKRMCFAKPILALGLEQICHYYTYTVHSSHAILTLALVIKWGFFGLIYFEQDDTNMKLGL